jgi:hypothetical protein
MRAEKAERLQSVQVRHYTADAEADVLRILQSAFGPEWGDSSFWRWKHCSRPGFSPLDVRIYTSGGAAIGCWHMACHSVRLAPGLEVPASFAGDYALERNWRGAGIGSDPATLQELYAQAQRGVVARFAFTSQALYERLYAKRLGWHLMPTVTSRYRKLLNDRTIRGRVQAIGARLLESRFIQRLVRPGPFVVQVEVRGFSPCSLVIDSRAAACREELLSDPDLMVRIPYALLTIRLGRPIFALRVLIRAFLSGQVRTRGLARFTLRFVSSVHT